MQDFFDILCYAHIETTLQWIHSRLLGGIIVEQYRRLAEGCVTRRGLCLAFSSRMSVVWFVSMCLRVRDQSIYCFVLKHPRNRSGVTIVSVDIYAEHIWQGADGVRIKEWVHSVQKQKIYWLGWRYYNIILTQIMGWVGWDTNGVGCQVHVLWVVLIYKWLVNGR